jgi:hypothetical protein
MTATMIVRPAGRRSVSTPWQKFPYSQVKRFPSVRKNGAEAYVGWEKLDTGTSGTGKTEIVVASLENAMGRHDVEWFGQPDEQRRERITEPDTLRLHSDSTALWSIGFEG